MGLNMMEADNEDQRHFMAQSIISLMYKLYDPNRTGIIGPRFEHAIRNAMLTVMSVPGTSFIELVRCLTDESYVQEILPQVTDPVVRRYWTDQIAQTSDFHKSEILDYIVSKFGRFVTNKTMRNIIGQSKSAFVSVNHDEQKSFGDLSGRLVKRMRSSGTNPHSKNFSRGYVTARNGSQTPQGLFPVR